MTCSNHPFLQISEDPSISNCCVGCRPQGSRSDWKKTPCPDISEVLPLHPKKEAPGNICYGRKGRGPHFCLFLTGPLKLGTEIYLQVLPQTNLLWGFCRYKKTIHSLHVFLSPMSFFLKIFARQVAWDPGYLKGSRFAYKSKVEIHLFCVRSAS